MDVRFDRATPTLGRPVAHTANTFSAELCVLRVGCIVLPHSFIIVTDIQGVNAVVKMCVYVIVVCGLWSVNRVLCSHVCRRGSTKHCAQVPLRPMVMIVFIVLMLAGLAKVVKLAVVMMRLMLAGLAVVVMLAVEGREHHDEYHGHRSGVGLLLITLT
jgi:hypothetical protein